MDEVKNGLGFSLSNCQGSLLHLACAFTMSGEVEAKR